MTTVIYHSADFDGVLCREIAKRFLGEKDVNYIGWNFGDPFVPIPKDGEIYILDLSPECLVGNGAGAFFDRLIWIDHHKTSIEKYATDVPGYRIDGVAACRLAWQWFNNEDVRKKWPDWIGPVKQDFIDRKVSEPPAVRLAGEYDVWDHRGDGDLEFQFGLDSQATIPWHLILEKSDRGEERTHRIIADGQAAMQCYAKRDADIVLARSFLLRWEGLTWLCLNTARCNSLSFAAKDVPETGHDALLGFYFNGKVWTISLYHAKHRTDLDLSQIAVKHGGGGHRGACGFTCAGVPPFLAPFWWSNERGFPAPVAA